MGIQLKGWGGKEPSRKEEQDKKEEERGRRRKCVRGCACMYVSIYGWMDALMYVCI